MYFKLLSFQSCSLDEERQTFSKVEMGWLAFLIILLFDVQENLDIQEHSNESFFPRMW